jgi:hypothetical protein
VKRRPRVGVEPFTAEGTSGSWTVRWRIRNNGDQPIGLLSGQHPHSQFRTPKTAVHRDVGRGGSADLVLPVQFKELPGVIVENPFLILVFREGGESWRLLARVRVTAGTQGEPRAGQSVVVTLQKVETP